MKALIQRVASASLLVEEEETGSIHSGLVLFLGVHRDSRPEDAAWLAEKILKLRIFDSPDSAQAASLTETGGGLMIVSQFTLHASTRKGTRPSYHRAAPPEQAEALYESFLDQLRKRHTGPLITGQFGAHMNVRLDNDGPVTLIIDSQNRE